MCAFLQIWRWVLLPILVGNDLPRHDLPYSKGFMKFGCQEPSKKCLTFETLVRQRGVWPVRKGPPLWNFGIFDKLYFFQRNEINLRGKKCTALFHTHNWEKSSFFNAFVRVFAQIYANTTQGEHNVPYPGPYRVNFNDVPLLSKDGP